MGTEFVGKTAVVTGGSRGLGLAVAQELLHRGARVVITGRDEAALKRAAAELAAAGGEVEAVRADVGSERDVRSTFERARARFGPVHAVVNSAGAAHVRPLIETSLDEWNAQMTVHATGTFLMCREAVRTMGEGKIAGRIVNVSSVTAQTGGANAVAYAASKAAVLGLTRSLAREVAALGITVNAVCPGAIDTDLFNRDTLGAVAAMTKSAPEALLKGTLRAIPLGRLLAPAEVASLVVYLCSDLAAGITGQSYGISGGYDIH